MHVPRRIPRRPRDLAGALAVALCVLAAGCGDDGDDKTTVATATDAVATPTQPAPPGGGARDDKRLIEDAIRGALADADPGVACAEAVTPLYVEEAYGDENGCRQAVEAGGVANSVRVDAVGSSGGTASARATASGGPFDGEEVEVELVRRGGGWRVDSVTSNAPVGP